MSKIQHYKTRSSASEGGVHNSGRPFGQPQYVWSTLRERRYVRVVICYVGAAFPSALAGARVLDRCHDGVLIKDGLAE